MNSPNPIDSLPSDAGNDVRNHHELCQEILALVEREDQALRGSETYQAFEFCQARKQLMPRLVDSLSRLRRLRSDLEQSGSSHGTDIERSSLLRQTQDLVMKIIVRDRENEQALLRRGMIPPKHLPPANRQRPHFVTELYRRNSAS